jgi:long-chain acyl-CoA synthetase
VKQFHYVYLFYLNVMIRLGYASVRTLTDASVRNCKGDIKEFRPTLMTGVPAVWESIRKGILAKLSSASPNAQKIFHKAYASKAWLLERHLPTGFIDKVVFNKIKEQVGGRLRFALSGGAPVSVETQKFLSVTVCPILGGFGMTESKTLYLERDEDMN